MTPAELIEVAAALVSVIGALVALVIQTGRLVEIAEQYMEEQRKERLERR